MGDAYWSRMTEAERSGAMKRPRADYDPLSPGGRDVGGYVPRDDLRMLDGGRRYLREPEPALGYDRYARNGGLSSYGASDLGGLGRVPTSSVDVHGHGLLPPRAGGLEGIGTYRERPAMRDTIRGQGEMLPPEASNTLFVEGLPADCTRREAAHIFRPFLGFKEVRLVNKDAKNPGADKVVLCFVDFESPSCALTALEALQEYKLDQREKNSPTLKLQFARYPGPRQSGRFRN